MCGIRFYSVSFMFCLNSALLKGKMFLMKIRFFLFLLLSFMSFGVYAQDLAGAMTQGGLVIGKAPIGSKVWLNDTALKVGKDGRFVFGFHRDAKPSAVLKMQTLDGVVSFKTLKISQRKYDVEYVDGLPPKTVTPPASWLERRKVETGRVKQGRQQLTDDTYWQEDFILPAMGRISGVYGSQRVLNGKPRSPHYGLDVAADTGVDVVAPAGGIVRLAAPDFLLEGGIIIIDHGFGVTSTLFHLNSVDVKENQMVQKGQKIGTVGMTGRATGPHVDWRVNWQQVRLDPGLLVADLIKE